MNPPSTVLLLFLLARNSSRVSRSRCEYHVRGLVASLPSHHLKTCIMTPKSPLCQPLYEALSHASLGTPHWLWLDLPAAPVLCPAWQKDAKFTRAQQRMQATTTATPTATYCYYNSNTRHPDPANHSCMHAKRSQPDSKYQLPQNPKDGLNMGTPRSSECPTLEVAGEGRRLAIRKKP